MGKFPLQSIKSGTAPSTCCQDGGLSNSIIHVKQPCYCQQNHTLLLIEKLLTEFLRLHDYFCEFYENTFPSNSLHFRHNINRIKIHLATDTSRQPKTIIYRSSYIKSQILQNSKVQISLLKNHHLWENSGSKVYDEINCSLSFKLIKMNDFLSINILRIKIELKF